MSSKGSLLRALRRQKKEGERKARGERRRPIVVARTSSLRRFFRRHGVVHVPYVTCFCEDTWRKKNSFFGLQTVKAQSYCLPSSPSQFESLQDEKEEHKGLSTKDGHYERVQSIDLFREVLEDSKKEKKKEKKRDHPKEKNSRILLIRDFFSRVLE